MRIAVQCSSVLLQKSLETFLVGHLVSMNKCDFIISDEKLVGYENVLRVGSDSEADIVKPFSKSQLFLALERHYALRQKANQAQELLEEIEEEEDAFVAPTENASASSGSLETKIERLTAHYVKSVLAIVKEHYERA
ncbi:MAG: hypothetical protein KU37_07590 [Sulfuricurvum sp. PC08-66]|nr:MAG: hypothetical protein KU37_07590 [Sulfuricurvum sp. PC08-66]